MWFSAGKPTRRAVTTMGSNNLVVGEDHMLGPSCQRYNWHTGRCGSIAFGSSPRRGKTLISDFLVDGQVSWLGTVHPFSLQTSLVKKHSTTLIDFSSAFDTIDHPIHVHRLHTDFGFTDTVLQWFSSYLTDRTHYVSLSNHCSALTHVHSGFSSWPYTFHHVY